MPAEDGPPWDDSVPPPEYADFSDLEDEDFSDFDGAFDNELDDVDVEGPPEGNGGAAVPSEPVAGPGPTLGGTPAERMQSARAQQMEQSNELRSPFFIWAMRAAGIIVGLNFGVMSLYIWSQWGHLSDAVMVAWISATVVKILGIVFIIARYLFPTGSGTAD
ncbi:hypothetical protein [Sinomonas soli]